MKKDPNYIAAVEKAIAEKYGKDTVQDFRNDWEEEKEKELINKTQEIEDEIDKLEDIKFKLGTKLHKVDSTILHIDDLNYEKGIKELDKNKIVLEKENFVISRKMGLLMSIIKM